MSSTTDGDTTLAALAHASALVASFLGPVLFLVLADDDTLVRENAKNAIDFQIVIFVASLFALVLSFLLIGFVLFPVIALVDIVFVLIGTVKASNGEVYSYPFTPSIV